IFEYQSINSEPLQRKVKNINPYLVEGKDFSLQKLRHPICNVPEIMFGNMPNDGGHFLLNENERNELLDSEPGCEIYIKPFLGVREFLHGERKWCLWLKNIEPSVLKHFSQILKRVRQVKEHREQSSRQATKNLAQFPTLFGEIRQPTGKYILIPRVSSENRKYIPMGFFEEDHIAGDTCLTVPVAELFHFGILESAMHTTWVIYVAGRLKSDFRYSAEFVYNNFPWPDNPTRVQQINIEKAAQKVLDARALFPNSSLAELYDPVSMPPELVKAHNELDRAVDLAYRSQPFVSEANRMEFLFELYEKYTAGLLQAEKKKKRYK
ncbi:MAG: class I SAM-dependent DNA methyltransferase, partial [Candidatus Delongbacteria bacterium]|nr:class I SAM-dependent DNA methyltransferase [Candidatus Delongbacteria bacterium]